MHTLRIRTKLTKEGGKDIDLVVESYWFEQPSPCYVIENGARRLVGGHVGCLEEVFQESVNEYPGYMVQRIDKLIANVVA